MAAQQAGRGKAPRMTIETSQVEATPAVVPEEPAPKASNPQVVASVSEQRQAPKPKMVVTPTPVDDEPQATESEPLAAGEVWAQPQQQAPVVQSEQARQAPAAQAEPVNQEQASQTSASQVPASQAVAQQKKSVATMRRSFTGWVKQTFPGHEHAFYGALVALVLALLVFAIGIVRVLFICVLVVLGVAVGQILDGDPKIIRAVQELFSNERRER